MFQLVMSIGNQEFGIPRNTNTKFVFGIYVPNFLAFSWYFIGILSTTLLKFGLILVFLERIKIGLVFGFCGRHFIGIGLVLVRHFPESGIISSFNDCHLFLHCRIQGATRPCPPKPRKWGHHVFCPPPPKSSKQLFSKVNLGPSQKMVG